MCDQFVLDSSVAQWFHTHTLSIYLSIYLSISQGLHQLHREAVFRDPPRRLEGFLSNTSTNRHQMLKMVGGELEGAWRFCRNPRGLGERPWYFVNSVSRTVSLTPYQSTSVQRWSL